MDKVKTVDCRLVGVPIPLLTLDYMNLYLTMHGRTRASLIREEVQKWAERAQETLPEKLLLEKFHKQIRMEMEIIANRTPDFSKSKHLTEIRKMLKKKGLNESQIKYITNL